MRASGGLQPPAALAQVETAAGLDWLPVNFSSLALAREGVCLAATDCGLPGGGMGAGLGSGRIRGRASAGCLAFASACGSRWWCQMAQPAPRR